MIAEWMLYCILASIGLAVAAMLAERVLLAGRGPVRLVWVGAVAMSLIIPVAAFRFSSRATMDPEFPVPSMVADNAFDGFSVASEATVATLPVEAATPQHKVARTRRVLLTQYDQPLLVIWGTLSFALACNFIVSVLVLKWMRRSWQHQTVQGFSIYLSERSGPAVVGTLSPVIVLPKWALALAPSQLDLMLRHEEQHRLAGDGQLLTVARLTLIVMPWNFALWWQILRLRVAVELDCDARVLQHADARSYGDLLLEVAGTSRGSQLLGATAFAERATQLERRIRVLSRHRVRTSRAARAIVLSVGVAVLSVAWVAPHPAVPPSIVTPTSGTSTTVTAPLALTPALPALNTFPNTQTALQRGDSIVAPVGVVRGDSVLARVAKRDDSTRGKRATPTSNNEKAPAVAPPAIASLPLTTADTAALNAARRAQAQQADSALAFLFEGITLTRAQETAARNLIAKLQAQQVQQNQTVQSQRSIAQATRDSTLRSLVSDADRALLISRTTPGGRGARVGGSGTPPDTANGGAAGGGGRGGGAGGGRGGAPSGLNNQLSQLPGARGNATNGGGRGGPVTPQQLETAADATVRRMFDGIPLTPAQDSIAHAAVLAHLQVMTSSVPAIPPIRVNLVMRSVLVTAPADSAFVDIVASASDKALIRSRLTPIPPR